MGTRKERHRAVPLTHEVRFFNGTVAEIRERADTNEIVITGTPIVWNTPYVVNDAYGSFEERMNPSVGEDIIQRGFDVRLLFNHDGMPLARTKSGTMQLENTSTALKMTATIDARQQLANDLMVALERRDVSEMSVGFRVAQDEWSEDFDQREIFRFAEMFDASVVTFACSTTTEAAIAQRMALAVPVESRARIRQRYIRAKQTGDVDEALAAVRPFIDMEDRSVEVDPGEDTRTPTGTGRLGSPDGTGQTYADTGTDQGDDGSSGGGVNVLGGGDNADASGTRSEWPTREEHRAKFDSFNDIQQAVYEALLAKYPPSSGDSYDLYVCDIGNDWVVWQTYCEPAGLFQLSYVIDSDGVVTFGGDPRKVAQVTDYVAAPDQTSTSSRAKALQLRAAALKASIDA